MATPNNIKELLKAKGLKEEKTKKKDKGKKEAEPTKEEKAPSPPPPSRSSAMRIYNVAPVEDEAPSPTPEKSSDPEKVDTNRTQSEHKEKVDTNRTQTEHTEKVDTNWSQSGHTDQEKEPDTKWSQTEHKLDTEKNETEHKVDTAPEETEHKVVTKPDTNRAQSEHKPDTELDTNRTQTDHKADTQKRDLDTKWAQSEHTTGHKKNTKRTQTEHKLDTNLQLSTVVGIQRKILFYMFHDCKNNRSKITSELTILDIAQNANVKESSVKTTIRRLQEKGFINRTAYKNGRGGWSCYELAESIYQDILRHEQFTKLDTNWAQTGHKVDTQPDTQPDTNPAYSSSSYINTTTTTETDHFVIPDNLKNLGVRSKSLNAGLEAGLSIEDIQNSLDAMSHDLENNQIRSSNPVNLLFGILRKGQPYISVSYSQKLNEELNEALKRAESVKQQAQAIEDAEFKAAFHDWKLKNPELVEKLLEGEGAIKRSEKMRDAFLMDKFRDLSA